MLDNICRKCREAYTFKNYLLQEPKEYFRKTADILNRTQKDLFKEKSRNFKKNKVN